MINSPDQLNLNIKLDDSVSLEKFIHCESNKEALNFLKKSLEKDSVSNLFYIWGEEGVGKSYIMQALNKELTHLNNQTFHLSLNDERINSPDIFKNLGSLDAILIEKIELLKKTENWEAQLFLLINEALSSDTKIYISSNVVSKDLDIDLKDLKSRLSYFTAIQIPEITEEEKIEALYQSSERRGIKLDEKTIDFILNYTSRSLSDLLRLLDEIDIFSLKKKKKVTPNLIRELLKSKSDNLRR